MPEHEQAFISYCIKYELDRKITVANSLNDLIDTIHESIRGSPTMSQSD